MGNSCHGVLAETINGLYKSKLIHQRCPWRNPWAVKLATLEWVDQRGAWRPFDPIRGIAPAEAGQADYRQIGNRKAVDSSTLPRKNRGMHKPENS